MQPYHENLRVELAEWEKEEKSIRAIRETVFIGEQAVPAELEWDGLDPLCAHVLAWNTSGEPIGTARMQRTGVIGRMAVVKRWRRQGIGQAILQKLLNLAAKQGLLRVTLSAQTHAVGFYERAGFQPLGELFTDAGISHQRMVKELSLPKIVFDQR